MPELFFRDAFHWLYRKKNEPWSAIVRAHIAYRAKESYQVLYIGLPYKLMKSILIYTSIGGYIESMGPLKISITTCTRTKTRTLTCHLHEHHRTWPSTYNPFWRSNTDDIKKTAINDTFCTYHTNCTLSPSHIINDNLISNRLLVFWSENPRLLANHLSGIDRGNWMKIITTIAVGCAKIA